MVIYGNVLKQKTVKQRPILFYGAGDMKTDEDDLNNEECDEYKRLRFRNEDSNDEEDKKLIFGNEDSKEVKYKRLRFGNEDMKENMRGLRKKNVAERKEKGKYNQRVCKLCRMAVYETPYKQEPEKCRECNRRVVYHCYRCCGCGCVPMDSRKVLWDETPKTAQCEDGDDDELFQEFYDA